MSSDDRQAPAPPAVTVAPADSDLLAPVETQLPAPLARPEMLVEGMRYLQQRIPEFTQLTVKEKRSHARAAHLDPEFIEHGLYAARVWRDTERVVHRSGEDLREEHEEIRRWEEVLREMRALMAGIEAANLKRKHRLGKDILLIYKLLGIYLRTNRPEDAYMRPHYEAMRRAYLRTQRFRKPKKEEEAPS